MARRVDVKTGPGSVNARTELEVLARQGKASAGSKPSGPPPPELEEGPDGAEHRQFPRARLHVPVSLWIGDGEDRRFSATLKTLNVSVSGAFLESSFFLPMGTQLMASFSVDEGDGPVRALAEVVREERADKAGRGRMGMAVRFVEFYAQSEVTLARLFLGQQLREFVGAYLSSKRARSLQSEADRTIDALAAWELLRVTSLEDVWGLKRVQE